MEEKIKKTQKICDQVFEEGAIKAIAPYQFKVIDAKKVNLYFLPLKEVVSIDNADSFLPRIFELKAYDMIFILEYRSFYLVQNDKTGEAFLTIFSESNNGKIVDGDTFTFKKIEIRDYKILHPFNMFLDKIFNQKVTYNLDDNTFSLSKEISYFLNKPKLNENERCYIFKTGDNEKMFFYVVDENFKGKEGPYVNTFENATFVARVRD